jgi:hypothetical protein
MTSYIFNLIHKILKKIFFKIPLEGEIVSQLIQKELLNQKSVMISRFGSTEIKAILYPYIPFFLRHIFKKRIFENMYTLSGFFPSNDETIRKFSQMMIEDLKLIDILGSWRIEEFFLEKYYTKAKRVKLNNLEPYLQIHPWSIALKGKKVLVIHPFNETIEYQYNYKREFLFKNPNVLPAFHSLQTIKSVQSIAGQKSEFVDWFSALNYMKSEVDKRDFDIAIIGCGAYGFPLAAHIKRMGKKAIHLGGATQILFGIKGKRWIENSDFNHIINEYFVFPNEADKVLNANKVEDACYW